MLFVLFGLGSLLAAMVTAANSLVTVVLGIGLFTGDAMSLLCAVLAIYGAVRNYRIGVRRIEINRDLQNERFGKPNV